MEALLNKLVVPNTSSAKTTLSDKADKALLDSQLTWESASPTVPSLLSPTRAKMG